MERILSENEKIRRAEEIYYRRNNKNISLRNSEENYKDIKRFVGSKIFLNLLIMFNIVVILYCVQNRNIIFKDEFLEKCSRYNVNITNCINEVISNFLNENSEEIIDEKIVIQEEINNESEESVEEIKDENNQDTVVLEEQTSSMSQMDSDVENLKRTYSFINPIIGIVSSGFGARESEYQNVTGYHTGIDIAADKGTEIKASMEGIVSLVSSEGDYRKTYKNKM